MALFSRGRDPLVDDWERNLDKVSNPNFVFVAGERGEAGHYRQRPLVKAKGLSCVLCGWEPPAVSRREEQLGLVRRKRLVGGSLQALVCHPSCSTPVFVEDEPAVDEAEAPVEALLPLVPHDPGLHVDGRTCAGCVKEAVS